MNQFKIKAKFYELIQTKMMSVPITPDTALERFADALIINMKDFKAGFSTEDMYQILCDPQMPEPSRRIDDPAEEALAKIEIVVNEELSMLSKYFSEKLELILSHDFGGIRFSKAIIEYKNLSSLDEEMSENEDDYAITMHELLYELMAAKKIDSHQIAGVEVSIIQTPSMSRTFGRVNLAGIGLLLLREVNFDENGRYLSVVSN